MMPAAPRTAFEVIEPQLVLEFAETVLDRTAALGGRSQSLEARRQGGLRCFRAIPLNLLADHPTEGLQYLIRAPSCLGAT